MDLRRRSCAWGIAVLTMIGAAAPASAGPFALSVQANGDDRLYRIDLATGVAIPVGTVGFADVTALAFHPTTGVLYGLDRLDEFTGQLITINPTTGNGTTVAFAGGDGDPTGLTFDQTGGNLFKTGFTAPSGGIHVRLHPLTGQAQSLPLVPLVPLGPSVSALAFRDGTLYGLAFSTNSLIAIHPVTGQIRTIGPTGVSVANGSGLDFDRNGVLWGIDTGGQIFQVNPQTGAVTLGATTSAGFKGLHVIKPVPIFTGAGAGGGPHVIGRVDTDGDGNLETVTASFLAYGTFSGGVRVARCDVDGDGITDTITAPGPGGGPHVRVFSGRTGAEILSFFAYDPAFTGGVYVACGDVNGDGKADIITGAGEGGGPHVKVFSGTTGQLLPGGPAASFLAYSAGFTGGVRVAVCDVNGDGVADIITAPGPGAALPVQVFNGATGAILPGGIGTFTPYPAFTGGVFVACGDINGDRRADVITGPGAGGGPNVKAFNGLNGTTIQNFNAYDPGFTGGVTVAAGDVNGDGRVDIITGTGPGGGPHVKAFDGLNLVLWSSFFAYTPSFTGGVWVAGGVGF